MSKVIFWDFDGTLSTPNNSFENALYTTLIDLGYTVDFHLTTEFFGNVYPWKSPFEDHSSETWETWWDALFRRVHTFLQPFSIDSNALPALDQKLKEKLTAIDNYTLYNDTVSTLEQCSEMGYKNILMTNNYPEIVANLEKLGIARFFTDFSVSSHVGYDKPRKEFYDYAKKLAGNSTTGYMIGDNPLADIDGGNQAGLITIYVHNGYLSTAAHCADTLAEIPSLLK